MLNMIQITHSYGDQRILDDISFSFKEKQYLIIGASGIGKSTLLNIAGSIIAPQIGSVQNTYQIGYIFQTNNLLADFTIKENIEIAMHIKKNKDQYSNIAEITGITKILNKFPNQISGGEKQRASIARTLASGCNFILADEPTGNLDPENAENIRKLFKLINQELNLGYIVCSHDYEWKKYTDETLELKKGKLCSSH